MVRSVAPHRHSGATIVSMSAHHAANKPATCTAEVWVPAEFTPWGADHHLTCDRVTGHDGKHRLVTPQGHTTTWSATGPRPENERA